MKHRDSYIVYLLMDGLFWFCFFMIITVNMVYQVETAHLNPLQLVLVGTMLETVAFVFQVPTGVVADVFSRRISIIIGICLTGLGFIVEGSFPRFEIILLSQLGWGIGSTFIDGAKEAWIAGELGEEHVGHAFLRGAQVSQVGSLLGAGASVALASISLNLPIIVGGALMVLLGCFLLFIMRERGFERPVDSERTTWRQMSDTLMGGLRLVRGRQILLLIMGVALFYGLYSEGFDRLWTAHMLENISLPSLWSLQPIVWFALIRCGSMLLTIGAVELLHRFEKRLQVGAAIPRVMFVLSLLQIGCVVVFALSGQFVLALLSYWGYALLRSIVGPLFSTWLTRNTDAKVRATVISFSGQVDAIGQIGGGPLVGVVGTLASIRAALIASAVLLSPVLLLFLRAIGLSKVQPPGVDE